MPPTAKRVKLTDSYIETFSSDKKDDAVWDSEVDGFGFRCRNGAKTFVFRYAIGGRGGRHLVNAKARLIRYAKDNLKYPALQATEAVNSPVHKWLIDTGCGHDIASRKELRALEALFKKANIPIMF